MLQRRLVRVKGLRLDIRMTRTQRQAAPIPRAPLFSTNSGSQDCERALVKSVATASMRPAIRHEVCCPALAKRDRSLLPLAWCEPAGPRLKPAQWSRVSLDCDDKRIHRDTALDKPLS